MINNAFKSDRSPSDLGSPVDHSVTPNHGTLPWQKFNVEKYLAKTAVKVGGDGYVRNKFNQIESDKVAMDRVVPDTRQSRYAGMMGSGKNNKMEIG